MRRMTASICLIVTLFVTSCHSPSPKGLTDRVQDNEFINGTNIQIDSCDVQTSRDLAQLCKIWGFLKYYHPDVAEGKYNWDFELFRTMQSVLNAQSKIDRENILHGWIQHLGDVKQADKPAVIDSSSVKMYPDISWIEDTLALGKISKQLTEIRLAKRSGDHHYVSIQGGIGNALFKNESAYSSFSYPDTGYRLLSLFRYWNIIQYYFPYKYLIDENWEDVLTRFIPLFVQAKDRVEYLNVLSKLIACIGDTHAQLSDKENTLGKDQKYRGDADISFVEGKAVVVNSRKKTVGDSLLEPGDVLLAVNGEPVEDIASRKLPDISASNYPTKLRILAFDLLLTDKEQLYVQFERNGKRQSGFIPCIPDKDYWSYRMQQDKPLLDSLTHSDILYLYLGSKEGGSIPEKISAKGMIIDLRCYPSQKVKGYWEFNQLYPAPTAFVKFTSTSMATPGLFSISHAVTIGKNNMEYFKGKKIILINELSQSQAEFLAMKYRSAPNTLVIGSTTAGADGNVSTFSLPGGIFTSISGLGVYYPDGGETQKIGIVPDIEVKPTIKGVRLGRDEVLDKAIELLTNE